MELTPIKVTCHSGYKADEYPVSFIWKDIPFNIIEITDRWYEGYNKPPEKRSDYFRIKTDPGNSFLIRHDLEKDKWFLVR
jgi:hypothetical protein